MSGLEKIRKGNDDFDVDKILDENCLISFSKLEEQTINQKIVENNPELRTILIDLHKLGLIVFFDHDILRETIITDPQWFNLVFKTILDYGRKKICLIIQEIFDIFLELKQNHHSIGKLNEESQNYVEKHLNELKKGVSVNLSMEDIWNDQ